MGFMFGKRTRIPFLRLREPVDKMGRVCRGSYKYGHKMGFYAGALVGLGFGFAAATFIASVRHDMPEKFQLTQTIVQEDG